MPESEIEKLIDDYKSYLAEVDSIRGVENDWRVAPARAELAALRAQAARAIDGERLRRLEDAALIVRLYAIWPGPTYYLTEQGATWALQEMNGTRIGTGPIVNGIPVLTDTARAAIVQALERREG